MLISELQLVTKGNIKNIESDIKSIEIKISQLGTKIEKGLKTRLFGLWDLLQL